jgi:ABC-type Na+ efflux pump permease subunit
MVWRLMAKDWYLQRTAVLLALAGAPVSLAVIAFGGKIGFTMGIILLVTILVSIGAQLVISTMVNERQEQTLAFVMSLPVSTWEYSVAKLLGALLIFLVPWGVCVAGSLALLWNSPEGVRGLIPFAAIMGMEILLSTSLMACVALITESQRWTVGVIFCGSMALNGVGYWVAHIPSIAKTMFGPNLEWSPAALSLLAGECVLIACALGTAMLVQSRKRDYL